MRKIACGFQLEYTDRTDQLLLIFMMVNIGSLSPLATTLIEQRVGFTSAFALQAAVFFFGTIVLLLSKKKYISQSPEGSITTKAIRCLWLVSKNKFSFELAKQSASDSSNPSSQVSWDGAFAADLLLVLKACRIFLFYPFFWLAYTQIVTNFISQAGTMETHGIPNDLLFNIDTISVLILGLVLEFLIYPFLRRLGLLLRPLTRITCGFLVISIAMAVLQSKIYSSPPCYDHPLSSDCLDGKVPNEVHVATQAPAYVLVAPAEIFAITAGNEYAFKQAPARMRSLVMALFLSTVAGGAVLGILVSPAFVDPKQVWAYGTLSIAALVPGMAFWGMSFWGMFREEDGIGGREQDD